MNLRLPIGTSDFLQLRRDGLHYVDKSGFIVDVLRSSARVLLLPVATLTSTACAKGLPVGSVTVPAQVNGVCSGAPFRCAAERLLSDAATPGWSGPSVFSRMARARR